MDFNRISRQHSMFCHVCHELGVGPETCESLQTDARQCGGDLLDRSVRGLPTAAIEPTSVITACQSFTIYELWAE